jgi:signal transduction histidine kinase
MSVMFRGSTWKACAYFCLTFFTSALWFTVIATMLVLGVVLLIVGIGLPILVATIATARWLGGLDRRIANALLGAGVEAPPPASANPRVVERAEGTSWWAHTTAMLADAPGWRHVAWLAVAPITMTIGFTAVILAITVAVSTVLAVGTGAFALIVRPESWETDVSSTTATTLAWALIAGGVLAALLSPALFWAVRGMGATARGSARWALGPSRADELAAATARAERAEAQVRIDQELHDSIGHMITMTVVQAGAAAHVFESDPDFAREALKNIEERGRSAMGDLDRIIASIQGSASTAPLMGADAVDALVADTRAAGVEIAAELDWGAGGVAEVPDSIGRAVYSTVREALTNAVRHAPGAPVTLAVRREGDDLRVRASNPAPTSGGKKSREGGRGLAGMRDRIELLGGAVKTGTRAGVFTVDARIPLAAAVPATASPKEAE